MAVSNNKQPACNVEIQPPEFGMLFAPYQELSRIADDGCEGYAYEAALYLRSLIQSLGNLKGKKWTFSDVTSYLPQLSVLFSTSEFQPYFLDTFLFNAWRFLREEIHASPPRYEMHQKLHDAIVVARKKFAVTSISDYETKISREIDSLQISALAKEDAERFDLKPIPLFEVEDGGPLVLQIICSACFEKFHREDGTALGDWLGLVELRKHDLAYDLIFLSTHPSIWMPMVRSWDVRFYAAARRKKDFNPLKWWCFTQGFIYQDIDRFNQEHGDGIIRSQKTADSLITNLKSA